MLMMFNSVMLISCFVPVSVLFNRCYFCLHQISSDQDEFNLLPIFSSSWPTMENWAWKLRCCGLVVRRRCQLKWVVGRSRSTWKVWRSVSRSARCRTNSCSRKLRGWRRWISKS